MAQPVRCTVTTRSGAVHVVAVPGAGLTVEGGSVVAQHDGVLEIRRDRDKKKIVVHCAAGSDVTIGTVSGSIDTEGALGAVRVATVSGKVNVREAARVDVRAKSGAVEIGTVTDECRVVVTSAKVRIGRARRAAIAGVSGVVVADDVEGADVKTVSGKVTLGTAAGGHVTVRTVSGKVEIRVPPEMQPNTRLKSVTGRIECDCERGDDGEIAVASVSGAIRVSSGS